MQETPGGWLMLPDILFEAVQELEFYQAEYPQLYEQYREEIDQIKNLMELLRVKIERPPGTLLPARP
jgi:hypothetical protein